MATVYNINLGHNKDLMQSCTTLSQYAQLVDKVRFYRKQGYSNGKAIDMAVEYCIENDILRDFLVKNRSEVYHMFDFDRDIRKYHKLVLRNIKKLQEEVAEKEDVIVKKDDMIAEKDNVIAEKDNALAEQAAKIKALEEMLAKQAK